MKKYNRAFTIIELMIVISIIALLSSIVLVSLNSSKEKAMGAKAIMELSQINNILQMYAMDNKVYPCGPGAKHYFSLFDGNPANATCMINAFSTYGAKFPVADPWGNQYVYHYHPGTTEWSWIGSAGKTGCARHYSNVSECNGEDWWAEHNKGTGFKHINVFLGNPGPL